MRILSLYYTHKPGGFCKRLYRMLNALAAGGDEVTFLALDQPPASLDPKIKFQTIPFPLKARDGILFWILFTLWCPFFVAWYARQIKPDLYAVFGAFYASMVNLSRTVSGGKIILFMRSLVFKINRITNKAPLLITAFDFLEKTGTKAADVVVCMTKAMQQELETFVGSKLENVLILPNDLPHFNPSQKLNGFSQSDLDILNRAPIKLLTSGVLDRRKNLDLVLDALAAMRGNYRSMILLLVAGDGPLLEAYKQKAAALKLDNVIFLGWCSSLDYLYTQVQLLIHPSLHEGMPNSVLEALSANMAVLVARTPELREFVGDDELTFSSTEVSDLAAKLERICAEPSQLAALAHRSEELSNRYRFDWDGKITAIVHNS